MKLEERLNMIKQASLWLHDGLADEDVDDRKRAIDDCNLLLDRAVYMLECVVSEISDRQFEGCDEGCDCLDCDEDSPDMMDEIDEIEDEIKIIDVLAKARAYLEARNSGYTERKQIVKDINIEKI